MSEEERIIKTGEEINLYGHRLRFLGITESGKYVFEYEGTRIISDEFPIRKELLDKIRRRMEIIGEMIGVAIEKEVEKLLS